MKARPQDSAPPIVSAQGVARSVDLVMMPVPRRLVPVVTATLALLDLAAPTVQVSDADLLPLAEGARIAGTSPRVLRDAVRVDELPAYGKQRNRVVRRGDLMRWIESRKVVHLEVDDRDIEARMRRLAGGAR